MLWFSSRKNKKTWGLVYNALTKEPVQFAIVRAFNSIDNSFVKQSITDTQGKYGFVLDSGNYIIKVEQSGYEPFNKNISVNRTEEIVNLDIPLTKAESENIFFKINEYFRKSLKIFSLILSIIGIIFTILAIVFSPNVINIIIFVIYDIQIIIYIALQPPRGWGYIYNSQTNERVNGAFVRLFDTKEGRQIDVQMVDTKGRYGFLADDKKEYYLRADCNGYKFPSGKDSDKTIKLENGEIFIKADIKQGINNEIALDPV